jgi:aminoglycoside/choline kinase family phosphotransferase
MTENHPLQNRSRWIQMEPLAGDASTRQYTRLGDRQGETVICAEYPDEARRVLPRDREVLQWLAGHGVRVPRVIAHDDLAGWILVEDFGSEDAEQTLQQTPPEDRGMLLRTTLGPLVALSRIEPADLPGWNPPLDGGRMRWELSGFELWFVGRLLGKETPRRLGRWLDGLTEEISCHPRRVCHRDYHLNNLFFLPDGEVGVIDVQDILVGPDTYDAVSLVAERATPGLVGPDQCLHWLEAWVEATGVFGGWQDRLGRVRLQRALKVLGTFARLTVVGRPHYRRWLEILARELAEDAGKLELPAELVALLVDLQD